MLLRCHINCHCFLPVFLGIGSDENHVVLYPNPNICNEADMHLVHSTIIHAENDIHFAETQAITDLFHAGHIVL